MRGIAVTRRTRRTDSIYSAKVFASQKSTANYSCVVIDCKWPAPSVWYWLNPKNSSFLKINSSLRFLHVGFIPPPAPLDSFQVWFILKSIYTSSLTLSSWGTSSSNFWRVRSTQIHVTFQAICFKSIIWCVIPLY